MPDDLPYTPTPAALAMNRLRWCAQLSLPEMAGDAIGELVEPMESMCTNFDALVRAMSSWMGEQAKPERLADLAAALSAFEESWADLVGPDA
jgi:hypothetical protein